MFIRLAQVKSVGGTQPGRSLAFGAPAHWMGEGETRKLSTF